MSIYDILPFISLFYLVSAFVFPIVAVILIVISIISKTKTRKSRIVLRIIACLLIVPDIFYGYFQIKNIIKEHEERKSLWYCICGGYYEDAEKLLKKGVPADCTKDSNEKAKPGENTILGEIVENGIYYSYNEEHILKASELLIKYGADVNYKYHDDTDYYKYSGDPKSYYNASERNGNTPLLSAVEHQNYALVEFMLNSGANVNDTNDCGFSAISLLADEGESNPEILKLLMDRGAEMPEKTSFEQPLDFLVFRHPDVELDNAVDFMRTLDPDYLNLKNNVRESDYVGIWATEDYKFVISIYKDEEVDQYMAVIANYEEYQPKIAWQYPIEFEKGYMINIKDGSKYVMNYDERKCEYEISGLAVFSITEDGLIWHDLIEDIGADKVFNYFPDGNTEALSFKDGAFHIVQ